MKKKRRRRRKGTLDQRARAYVPVHRRRPWNGELCRLVQPAGSWSLQRATKRIVCVRTPAFGKDRSPNKTTNVGSAPAARFPTLYPHHDAITSVVRSLARCVGRHSRVQADTHVLGANARSFILSTYAPPAPRHFLTLPSLFAVNNPTG